MSRFSDTHAPPISPDGPVIKPGVREAILDWFAREGVSSSMIWHGLRLEQGFGRDWQATGQDLLARFPTEAVIPFIERNRALAEKGSVVAQPGYDRFAKPSLLGVPDPLFLDSVEVAMELLREERRSNARSDGVIAYVDDRVDDAVAFVNRLLQRRGIDYRVGEDGDVQWHGDARAYEEVVAPALSVLDDPRLAGARSEFDAARAHLRAGTPKDLEDAIEEAAKAVESAMKAVLDNHQLPLPSPATAQHLWNELRDAVIVPPKAEAAVLGPSRLRNEYGGHGSGSKVRTIPEGIPDLVVQAAASAIVYLAGRLP